MVNSPLKKGLFVGAHSRDRRAVVSLNWIGLASIAKWFLEIPLSLCIPVVGFMMFKYLQVLIDDYARQMRGE